jgi:hypothetical protein
VIATPIARSSIAFRRGAKALVALAFGGCTSKLDKRLASGLDFVRLSGFAASATDGRVDGRR